MAESKVYLCSLKIKEEKVILEFPKDMGFVNLTTDNQEEIKKLFTKIIENATLEDFSFELEKQVSSDIRPLLVEISKEYLNQINTELICIRGKYNARFDKSVEE